MASSGSCRSKAASACFLCSQILCRQSRSMLPLRCAWSWRQTVSPREPERMRDFARALDGLRLGFGPRCVPRPSAAPWLVRGRRSGPSQGQEGGGREARWGQWLSADRLQLASELRFGEVDAACGSASNDRRQAGASGRSGLQKIGEWASERGGRFPPWRVSAAGLAANTAALWKLLRAPAAREALRTLQRERTAAVARRPPAIFFVPGSLLWIEWVKGGRSATRLQGN